MILLLDVERQLVKYLQKIVHERSLAEAFQQVEVRSKVAECLCVIRTRI